MSDRIVPLAECMKSRQLIGRSESSISHLDASDKHAAINKNKVKFLVKVFIFHLKS